MAKWIENNEYEHFVFDLVENWDVPGHSSTVGYVASAQMYDGRMGWYAFLRSTNGYEPFGEYERLQEAQKAVEEATDVVPEPFNPPVAEPGGFRPGEFWILSARPGTQKSLYVESLAAQNFNDLTLEEAHKSLEGTPPGPVRERRPPTEIALDPEWDADLRLTLERLKDKRRQYLEER